MENKLAISLCIFGGFLMIISSVIGSISFFETIFEYIKTELGEDTALIFSIVVQILAYIAMGGGISVIIGAIIAAKDQIKIGKFIIGVGACMGLIGLLILFLTGIIQGTINEQISGIILEIINGSYGFLGVIIIIFARMRIKNKKSNVKE